MDISARNDAPVKKTGFFGHWTSAPSLESTAGPKNMMLLIQLRWIAVIGQITTMAVITTIDQLNPDFGIDLPLSPMLSIIVGLTAFNLASYLRWSREERVTNYDMFFAMLVDVGSLTAQLYFSGGTTNPFAFLYLLQVILAAVLLESKSSWIIVGITSVCLAGLALFSKPLSIPFDYERGIASLYVQGLLICFILNAALLVFLITAIAGNVRSADAQLASLRQRAAEEEHIVRMGLLASGAAHELGTPLATLSVILGDWRRMPQFAKDPELLDEIGEMQAQLQRCKSIVSGILLSAGKTRGESSAKSTINTFLNELASEWRLTRPIVEFVYENHIEEDLPMVLDSALKQTLYNVLDNAFEASPSWVKMEADRDGEMLILSIADGGPGFSPAMLADFGKPYQSTKGRPGSGLGLFLSVNVIRTLGGTITPHNRPEGGAAIQISLPLASIALK